MKTLSPPPVEDVEKSNISKTEAKEKAIKIIEQKLKAFEEKKEHEDSQGQGTVKKKTSHFWSDFKVYLALTILLGLAIAAVIVKVRHQVLENCCSTLAGTGLQSKTWNNILRNFQQD